MSDKKFNRALNIFGILLFLSVATFYFLDQFDGSYSVKAGIIVNKWTERNYANRSLNRNHDTNYYICVDIDNSNKNIEVNPLDFSNMKIGDKVAVYYNTGKYTGISFITDCRVKLSAERLP